MKKFIVVLIFIFVLLLPIKINALVDKSEYEFVTDSTDTLSNDTIDYIVEYSNFLYESNKIDYYVVVVNDLEGYSLEEYTDEIYYNYNISDKGLLILLSINDRKMRVKVGEELSDIIPSQIIDEYIDNYFMPEFKNGEWEEGIKNGYSAFYKMICNYYDIDSSSMEVYNDGFFTKYKVPIIFLIIWFNTLIGYVFSEYFIRIFIEKNSRDQFIDTLIFGVVLFISILLFILSYLLIPKSVFFVLGFEIVAIISNFVSHENDKKQNKTKKKRIVKKN